MLYVLISLILLILWILLGFVVLYMALLLHKVRAYIKGYDVLRWWDKKQPDINTVRYWPLKLIIMVLVWPIALILFLSRIPQLYDAYNIRQSIYTKEL